MLLQHLTTTSSSLTFSASTKINVNMLSPQRPWEKVSRFIAIITLRASHTSIVHFHPHPAKIPTTHNPQGHHPLHHKHQEPRRRPPMAPPRMPLLPLPPPRPQRAKELLKALAKPPPRCPKLLMALMILRRLLSLPPGRAGIHYMTIVPRWKCSSS